MVRNDPPCRSRFYRHWSASAARMALTAADRKLHGRCAHSANMWAMIADAIDAGDEARFARLTRNLLYLSPERLSGS